MAWSFPYVRNVGIRVKNTPPYGEPIHTPRRWQSNGYGAETGRPGAPSPQSHGIDGMRGETMDEHLTENLFGELIEAETLEEYLDQHELGTPSLADYLQEELAKRGLKKAEVLKRAEIEQTFGWYVFNGQRGMGRDNVLKLCFGMGFDTRHANRALQAAGANALYAKNRRDAIIIYSLEHGYTLREANDALYAFGEECL